MRAQHNVMKSVIHFLLISLTIEIQPIQCMQDIFSIGNIQNVLDEHLYRKNSNRNAIKDFYPRPFVYSSRGGHDGSSDDNVEEIGQAILVERDSLSEDSGETNKHFDATLSSHMLPLDPPSPHLAKKHFHDQYEEPNDDRSSGITPDNWISSFQSQIQAIREEMEHEAALELEHVKQEILEIRERKKWKLDEEMKMKAKENLERLSKIEKESENAVDGDTDYWQGVTEQLIQEVNEDSKSEKPRDVDDVQKDVNAKPSTDEIQSQQSVEELLIIGDTDESEDDVVFRLSNKLKGIDSNPKFNISDDALKIEKSLKVPPKEPTFKSSSVDIASKPQIERKKLSKRSKKAQRKKSKATKQSNLSKATECSMSTSKNLPISSEFSRKKAIDELSSTLGQKIIGRSIQALILLAIFGLATHTLFGEGGGAKFLLKGLLMPFMDVSD